MTEDMRATGGNRYHLNITQIVASGTDRDVINYTALNWPSTFAAHCDKQAKEHLAYATKSTSPTAARIASSCGRRCEQIAKAVRHGSPLDLDDMRIRVEAFNLACNVMGLGRTHRNAIVNRMAVAHVQQGAAL